MNQIASERRSASLPDFPWDLLAPAKAIATTHPGGLVDLSIGTPVDPVAPSVRQALAEASNAPGYPLTAGSPRLRATISAWISGYCRAMPGFDVLPTIGSKELVAWLPTLLGIGPGDSVVIPRVCYPTYEVGVRLAGASVIRADAPAEVPATARVRLVWVNSPANPTGRVLPPQRLADVVEWSRTVGAVVASDECYLALPWDTVPVSILEMCAGDFTGVLAVHSLSKRSNLAGYRAGFVAGDPSLVSDLLAVRKHAGMIVPAPVQAAMIAALADEAHVDVQRERYRERRGLLRAAVESAGLRVEHSEAGLYLWLTRDEPCWATVDWFARRGILVAPGDFYGPAGKAHVRLALTVSDERARTAVARLAA